MWLGRGAWQSASAVATDSAGHGGTPRRGASSSKGGTVSARCGYDGAQGCCAECGSAAARGVSKLLQCGAAPTFRVAQSPAFRVELRAPAWYSAALEGTRAAPIFCVADHPASRSAPAFVWRMRSSRGRAQCCSAMRSRSMLSYQGARCCQASEVRWSQPQHGAVCVSCWGAQVAQQGYSGARLRQLSRSAVGAGLL